MFPLIHYFTNKKIFGQVPPLMKLGGFYPDFAAGSGYNRDAAHLMGDTFYIWCIENQPAALPLALGILSHGSAPGGVDYYADEHWPNCERGWCFEEGKPWMKKIAAASKLPENLIFWKSHNFVEMTCELIVNSDENNLSKELLSVIDDKCTIEYAAEILAAYTDCDKAKIAEMFNKAAYIFALEEVTPQAMAEKQQQAFAFRHNVVNSDVPGMAAVLDEMRESICDRYYPYIEQSTMLVGKMLDKYKY